MFFQSLSDCHERPDEHSRIPAILSALDIFLGLFVVRLFHETFGFEEGRFVAFDPGWRWQFCADMNITVTRRGLGWLDTNGDDHLAAAGEVEGIRQHLLELLFFWDDVVGWEHRHYTRRRPRAYQCGTQCHGRAGVPTNGFCDHVCFWQFRELLPDL